MNIPALQLLLYYFEMNKDLADLASHASERGADSGNDAYSQAISSLARLKKLTCDEDITKDNKASVVALINDLRASDKALHDIKDDAKNANTDKLTNELDILLKILDDSKLIDTSLISSNEITAEKLGFPAPKKDSANAFDSSTDEEINDFYRDNHNTFANKYNEIKNARIDNISSVLENFSKHVNNAKQHLNEQSPAKDDYSEYLNNITISINDYILNPGNEALDDISYYKNKLNDLNLVNKGTASPELLSLGKYVDFMYVVLSAYHKNNSNCLNAGKTVTKLVNNSLSGKNPILSLNHKNALYNIAAFLKEGSFLKNTTIKSASSDSYIQQLITDKLGNTGNKASLNKDITKFLKQIVPVMKSKRETLLNSEEDKVDDFYNKEYMALNNIREFLNENSLLVDDTILSSHEYYAFRKEMDSLEKQKALNGSIKSLKLSELFGSYPGGYEAAKPVLDRSDLGCKGNESGLLANIICYASMTNPDRSFDDIVKDKQLIIEAAAGYVSFARENALYNEQMHPLGDNRTVNEHATNIAAFYAHAYKLFEDIKFDNVENIAESKMPQVSLYAYKIISDSLRDNEETVRKGTNHNLYNELRNKFGTNENAMNNISGTLASRNYILNNGEDLYQAVAARIYLNMVAYASNDKAASQINQPYTHTLGRDAALKSIMHDVKTYVEVYKVTDSQLYDYCNGGACPIDETKMILMTSDACDAATRASYDAMKSGQPYSTDWHEERCKKEHEQMKQNIRKEYQTLYEDVSIALHREIMNAHAEYGDLLIPKAMVYGSHFPKNIDDEDSIEKKTALWAHILMLGKEGTAEEIYEARVNGDLEENTYVLASKYAQAKELPKEAKDAYLVFVNKLDDMYHNLSKFYNKPLQLKNPKTASMFTYYEGLAKATEYIGHSIQKADTSYSVRLKQASFGAHPRNLSERNYMMFKDFYFKSLHDGLNSKYHISPSDYGLNSEYDNYALLAGFNKGSRIESLASNAIMYHLLNNPDKNYDDIDFSEDAIGKYSNDYIEFLKATPVYETYSNKCLIKDEATRKENLKKHAEFYSKWREKLEDYTIGDIADPENLIAHANEYIMLNMASINCLQNEDAISALGAPYYDAYNGKDNYDKERDAFFKKAPLFKAICLQLDPKESLEHRLASKIFCGVMGEKLMGKKIRDLDYPECSFGFYDSLTISVNSIIQEFPREALQKYITDNVPFAPKEKMDKLFNDLMTQTLAISNAVQEDYNKTDIKTQQRYLNTHYTEAVTNNIHDIEDSYFKLADREKKVSAAVERFCNIMFSNVKYEDPDTHEIITLNGEVQVQKALSKYTNKPLREIARDGSMQSLFLSYCFSRGLTLQEFNTYCQNEDPAAIEAINRKIEGFKDDAFDMIVHAKLDKMAEYYANYCQTIKAVVPSYLECTTIDKLADNYYTIYAVDNTQSTMFQTLSLGRHLTPPAEVDTILKDITDRLGNDSFNEIGELGIAMHGTIQYVKSAISAYNEKQGPDLLSLYGAVSSCHYTKALMDLIPEEDKYTHRQNLGSLLSAPPTGLVINGPEKDDNLYFRYIASEAILGREHLMDLSKSVYDKDGDPFIPMETLMFSDLKTLYKMQRKDFRALLNAKDLSETNYTKQECTRYFDDADPLVPAEYTDAVRDIRSGKDYSMYNKLPEQLKKMLVTEYVYQNGLILSQNPCHSLDTLAERSMLGNTNIFDNPLLLDAHKYNFSDNINKVSLYAGSTFKDMNIDAIKTCYDSYNNITEQLGNIIPGILNEKRLLIYHRDENNKPVPVFDDTRDYTPEEMNQILIDVLNKEHNILIYNKGSYPSIYAGHLALTEIENTADPRFEYTRMFPMPAELAAKLVDKGLVKTDTVLSQDMESTERINFFNKMDEDEKFYYIHSLADNHIPYNETELEYIDNNMALLCSYTDNKYINDNKHAVNLEELAPRMTDIGKMYKVSRLYNDYNRLQKTLPEYDKFTIDDLFYHIHSKELIRGSYEDTEFFQSINDLLRLHSTQEVIMDLRSKKIQKDADERVVHENLNALGMGINEFIGNYMHTTNLQEILMDAMFENAGEHLTDPVTGKTYAYNSYAQFKEYGNDKEDAEVCFRDKPFHEAFTGNTASHIEMYLIGSGITPDELINLETRSNPDMADATMKRIGELRQGFADFISGLDNNAVSDIYIKYLDVFNKEMGGILAKSSSLDDLSANIDKLRLFSDGQSLMSQTLNYANNPTAPQAKLINMLQEKFYNLGTNMENATAGIMSLNFLQMPMTTLNNYKNYRNLYDDNRTISLLTTTGTLIKQLNTIKKTVAGTKLTMKDSGELGRLKDQLMLIGSDDKNNLQRTLDDENTPDIYRENLIKYCLGRSDALDFEEQVIASGSAKEMVDIANVRKTFNKLLLNKQLERETDEKKITALTEELKSQDNDDTFDNDMDIDDVSKDYKVNENIELLNRLQNPDEARIAIEEELNKPGMPHKYVVNAYMNNKNLLKTADESNKTVDLFENSTFKDYIKLGENEQKLNAAGFYMEYKHLFMPTPEKAAENLNAYIADLEDDKDLYCALIGRVIELGKETEGMKEYFDKLSSKTLGRYELASGLARLDMLATEANTSATFDTARNSISALYEKFKKDPNYQPNKGEYLTITKNCMTYKDKHYGESMKQVGGRRMNAFDRIYDVAANALDSLFDYDNVNRYTPLEAYYNELPSIKGGLLNSDEFNKFALSLEILKEPGFLGRYNANDTYDYVSKLEKLHTATKEYLDAKGSDIKSTSKGQKRYDLATKVDKYCTTYIRDYYKKSIEESTDFIRNSDGNLNMADNLAKNTAFVINHVVSVLHNANEYGINPNYMNDMQDNREKLSLAEYTADIMLELSTGQGKQKINDLLGTYKETVSNTLRSIMLGEVSGEEVFKNGNPDKAVEFLLNSMNSIRSMESDNPELANAKNKDYAMLPTSLEEFKKVQNANLSIANYYKEAEKINPQAEKNANEQDKKKDKTL